MSVHLLYVGIACASLLLMAITSGLIIAISILGNHLLERIIGHD